MVTGIEVAKVVVEVVLSVALSVYRPASLIDRLLNVAMPLTAAIDVVPAKTELPLARVRVTESLLPVWMVPLESSTATVTAGEILSPAAVLLGFWINAR